MANPFEAETGQFLVLVNTEGQYSLWPAFRELPNGWIHAGCSGTRQACLDWIDVRWTDMRPKSLAERSANSSH